MTDTKEVSINGKRTLIEIIEKDAGQIEDAAGYVQPTHNCYGFIGWELNDDGERTGRKIAGAGNNADGEVEYADECTSLQDYLKRWDSEWQDDFRREGLLPEIEAR